MHVMLVQLVGVTFKTLPFSLNLYIFFASSSISVLIKISI